MDNAVAAYSNALASCIRILLSLPMRESLYELPQPAVIYYVKVIAETAIESCRRLDLNPPHLPVEPGHSLVARAGVAIYRVNTVKRQAGRVWLLVDGGMADNLRPALY